MTKQPNPKVWMEGAGNEPQYITLIGPKGDAARLYCPFIALCICPVGTIRRLQPVTVMAVRATSQRRLVYIIAGKGYYQSNFRILIEL